MNPITDIKELIELSLGNIDHFGDDIACRFIIYEDGQEYEVYNANLAYRDILLYSTKGVLNYLVDSYGDNHTIELVSIEE